MASSTREEFLLGRGEDEMLSGSEEEARFAANRSRGGSQRENGSQLAPSKVAPHAASRRKIFRHTHLQLRIENVGACEPEGGLMARAIPFKQADVSRAVKGAILGGMKIERVEIDPASGKIVILSSDSRAQEENPLDKWLRKHAG